MQVGGTSRATQEKRVITDVNSMNQSSLVQVRERCAMSRCVKLIIRLIEWNIPCSDLLLNYTARTQSSADHRPVVYITHEPMAVHFYLCIRVMTSHRHRPSFRPGEGSIRKKKRKTKNISKLTSIIPGDGRLHYLFLYNKLVCAHLQYQNEPG